MALNFCFWKTIDYDSPDWELCPGANIQCLERIQYNLSWFSNKVDISIESITNLKAYANLTSTGSRIEIKHTKFKFFQILIGNKKWGALIYIQLYEPRPHKKKHIVFSFNDIATEPTTLDTDFGPDVLNFRISYHAQCQMDTLHPKSACST